MNFKLVSDGSCDLYDEIIKQHDIDIVPFYLSFDGLTYKREKVDIGVMEFYQQMVDNPSVYPKTSMPTVEDYYNVFEKYASVGLPIICICITTKFSGSFNSATIAKVDILEKYPTAKIEIVDAMMNTCLQGLLVQEAARMNESGKTFEEACELINKIKQTGRIFFTVEGIEYLKHGGRIGKLAGLIGSALRIKPIIVLKEGEIFSLGISPTKKLAVMLVLKHLKKHFEDNKIDYHNYRFVVGNGIDQEAGASLHIKVQEIFPDVEVEKAQIGATIGVHTGPYPLGIGLIQRFDTL